MIAGGRRVRVRRAVVVLAMLLVAWLSAACGIQVTDLPLPGTRVSGESRSLRIEFSNVLNLPARSKVLLNGTKVGVLRSVGIGGSAASPVAVATVDLESDVVVPQGTRAALEQSTLLGDIYISLTPSGTGGGGRLGDGATIPVAQTTVTPAVEDLLGGIAALANGGTLEKIQRTVDKANTAFPQNRADRDKGIETSRELIARIAENSSSVGQLIDSLGILGRSVQTQGKDLGFALDVGPERIGGALVSFVGFAQVLTSLGFQLTKVSDLFGPRYKQLVGLITTANPLVDLAVSLDASAPSDIARLDDLVSNKILPLLASPSVNIVDITSPRGLSTPAASNDQIRTVASTLRMIGAMR
ncbi:MlaD family protein [Williamsia phyllosphaerae]|uniref:Mce family protein n=1 Tax=Williamsia phyllosphaerae TaxID=885042 RepID=A0ABQ1V2E7_9NOCA|nr:MlaD family protein [Williamsia phyllosphaerae]GGF34383.1 putative Mce family protein [Williamsia phyllosphaerae]